MCVCIINSVYRSADECVLCSYWLSFVLSGMDDVIRYDAGRVIKPIAEQANLELCDDTCTVARVRVTVSLHTRDVTSSTCERDTQSVQSQRSLCGKNEAVVGTTTLRIIYQVAPCLHIQYNVVA